LICGDEVDINLQNPNQYCEFFLYLFGNLTLTIIFTKSYIRPLTKFNR